MDRDTVVMSTCFIEALFIAPRAGFPFFSQPCSKSKEVMTVLNTIDFSFAVFIINNSIILE